MVCPTRASARRPSAAARAGASGQARPYYTAWRTRARSSPGRAVPRSRWRRSVRGHARADRPPSCARLGVCGAGAAWPGSPGSAPASAATGGFQLTDDELGPVSRLSLPILDPLDAVTDLEGPGGPVESRPAYAEHLTAAHPVRQRKNDDQFEAM